MPTASRIRLNLTVEGVPCVAKSSVVGDPNVPSLVEVSLKLANEAILGNWSAWHPALTRVCAPGFDGGIKK